MAEQTSSLDVAGASQSRWSAMLPLLRIGALLLASCDGIVAAPSATVDADQDGYTAAIDCDDDDAAIHPGATEICGDGIDQDCDGADGACAACGDAVVTGSACLCGGANHTNGVCCSDAWHDDGYCCGGSWQTSVCAGCADGDTDGHDDALCGGDDCDDSRGTVHPGADEVCGDGIDQDCSGSDLACPGDTTAPTLSAGQPSGLLPEGTTQTSLRVTTDEAATCRWSTTPGTSYGAMANTFATTGGTSHETVVTGLADGQSYTYYIRCQDGAGNANVADFLVSFSVSTDAGPISVSLVPSRTSGVAPLSVFFDATGTTDTAVTARPFHDLEYRWSFGDPAGGAAWAYGTQPGVSSKNLASGAVAGHVFETPGTYTISLTVSDGTNTDAAETIITVDDPDVVFAGTNTICVAATSLPVAGANGCPAGAATYQQADFSTAINTYAQTNSRILFNRGDTFTATAAGTIDQTGPGIIGSYGTGALPIAKIVADGAFPIIQLSGPYTPGIGDWRVMDFEIDGSSVFSSDVTGIGTHGGFDQFLAIRLYIHDIWRGIAAGASILDWWNNHGNPGHTMFDQWSVVDSTITALPGCNSPGNYNCDWRILMDAKRVNIQGNSLDNQDTGGSHVIRSGYVGKGVISNNTIARAGDFQLAIKLHAGGWGLDGVANPGAVGTYTERVIIADNEIIGGINPWTISLGPQDEISDERERDIIVERNWFIAGSATQLHMHINSSETTIRNNICDLTTVNGATCVGVDQWGITPAPSDVRIYNNTFYSTSSGIYVTGVEIGTASNTTVQNNLGSAPNASGPVMIIGSGTGLVESNNLWNNTPSSLFVSATPSLPADFRLTVLPNPARDSGLSSVPVLSDFFRTTRPQSSAIDIGATEQ